MNKKQLIRNKKIAYFSFVCYISILVYLVMTGSNLMDTLSPLTAALVAVFTVWITSINSNLASIEQDKKTEKEVENQIKLNQDQFNKQTANDKVNREKEHLEDFIDILNAFFNDGDNQSGQNFADRHRKRAAKVNELRTKMEVISNDYYKYNPNLKDYIYSFIDQTFESVTDSLDSLPSSFLLEKIKEDSDLYSKKFGYNSDEELINIFSAALSELENSLGIWVKQEEYKYGNKFSEADEFQQNELLTKRSDILKQNKCIASVLKDIALDRIYKLNEKA